MKTIAKNIKPFFIFTPLFAVVVYAIMRYWPNQLVSAYSIFWLFLIMSLLIMITPLGNRRLAKDSSAPRLTPLAWLSRIWLVEISFLLVFFGISGLSGQSGLLSATSYPQNFLASLYNQLVHYGLFPWSLYGLIAAAFAYSSMTKNQDTYFHTLARPFFKTNNHGAFALSCDLVGRLALMCALAITSAYVILMLSQLLIGKAMLSNITGLYLPAMASSLIIIGLSLIKKVKRYIYLASGEMRLPPAGIMIISIILLSLLLAILAYFFEDIRGPTLAFPKLLLGFKQHDPKILWRIFAISWALLWTPLMALYFAHIAKGYRVRSLLLATLSLPLLLAILLSLNHHYHGFASIPFNRFGGLLASLGFFCLLIILIKRKTFSMISTSSLSRQGHFKYRSQHDFLLKWLRITALIFYVLLPFSALVMPVIALWLCLHFALTLFLYVIAIPKLLWHKPISPPPNS